MNRTLKTLNWGIEIETVGITQAALALAIHGVVGGSLHGNEVIDRRGRTWQAVFDASLNGGANSGEVVSPILAYEDIEELQEVVRALRAAGARTDSSTGIHVHVSSKRFDARNVTTLVNIVHKHERLIEHALGVSQGRLNRYCQPIDPAFMKRMSSRRPKTLAEFSEAWYGAKGVTPTRYHDSRYRGLNLNSMLYRNSLEYRYFASTLHAGEVKAYIQFCLALSAKALSVTYASSKRKPFNPATAKYDFRTFLVSLGMVGDDFKVARLHLTKHLGGSAAWKGERRDRRTPRAASSASASEATETGRVAA